MKEITTSLAWEREAWKGMDDALANAIDIISEAETFISPTGHAVNLMAKEVNEAICSLSRARAFCDTALLVVDGELKELGEEA